MMKVKWKKIYDGTFSTMVGNADFFLKLFHHLIFNVTKGLVAPLHITHTWGTEWSQGKLGINCIVASDILLYVR